MSETERTLHVSPYVITQATPEVRRFYENLADSIGKGPGTPPEDRPESTPARRTNEPTEE
jgi:hypothetical protein